MNQPTSLSGNGLGQLLDEIAELIHRYIHIGYDEVTALVLWIAHTHAIDAVEVTPYMLITAPTRASGKTRLGQLLEALVRRPIRSISMTPAAVFRIAERRPTLIIDELDRVFGGGPATDTAQALTQIINGGNERGALIYRCEGPMNKVVPFDAFCAKALIGIERTGWTYPDTVRDRSIPIRLRRKLTSESVERLGRDVLSGLRDEYPTRVALAVEPIVDEIRQVRPRLPFELGDRQVDLWASLLSIAALAGDTWLQRAWAASVSLSGGGLEPEEDTLQIRLLADIQRVLTGTVDDYVPSLDLVSSLRAIDDAPWARRDLTAVDLASYLRPFNIRSGTRRLGCKTFKGYRVAELHDAIARHVSGV